MCQILRSASKKLLSKSYSCNILNSNISKRSFNLLLSKQIPSTMLNKVTEILQQTIPTIDKLESQIASTKQALKKEKEWSEQYIELIQSVKILEEILILKQEIFILESKNLELQHIKKKFTSDESKDNDLVILVDMELKENHEKIAFTFDKLFGLLWNKEDSSLHNGAMIEIRPGVGGHEACLFCKEIFDMYRKFIEKKKNWNWETLSYVDERNGLREGIALVSYSSINNRNKFGPSIYNLLKFESGVHRVQRIPLSENNGRIHTSTARVFVLPEKKQDNNNFNLQEIIFETFRSSGAGGQHVNTTESAVRAIHKPTGMTVSIQSERSQHQNKRKAIKILQTRVEAYNQKIRSNEGNKLKNSLNITGDRHEKVRTYNFHRDQIIDHRNNISFNGIQNFLSGSTSLETDFMLPMYIDELINSIKKKNITN